MTKTNIGLVEYAKAQLGKPYWYATFGNIATADLYAYKRKQYPDFYKSWNNFPEQYGQRVHDCVGLIKGYLWSDTLISVPAYNSSQDVSANGMRQKCKETGGILSMPDIIGLLVFMDGHVGVYIGNGEVIEARGHEYGVVKTKLKNRNWKWWGKCPFISYDNNVNKNNETAEKYKIKIKSGTWNVRTGAATSFSVVTVVSGGNIYNASKFSNGWYFIDKFNGWVSGKGVTVIND